MVLSLESTTYPGTTDEELKPRIEARGLAVGRDLFLVQAQGALISYSDSHIPFFPKMRIYHFSPPSASLTRECLAGFDYVVLAIDHDKLDYRLINSSSQLLIDCSGKFPRAYATYHQG